MTKEEEMLSLTSGLSEIALDSILSDGIFKDIPFVGSLISIGKLTKSVSDRLLLFRILTFIKGFGVKSQSDIDEIKEKYFKDEDYQRIGSKLLLTLEKIDDVIKIKWLAKSFRMYLDKKVDQKSFLKISSIINTAFVSDIGQIIAFEKRSNITSNNNLIDSYVLDHMYTIGLLENLGIDGGDASGNNSGTIFGLNRFGEILLNEVIKE